MKQIIILFFAVIASFSIYTQTYIQDGDRCFDSADYTCAVTNYDNAFKNASGKDKQIAEIKLTRAKWCAEHIKTANQAFSFKNYTTAKDEYQKVLDSNPNDSHAQTQIVKCDNAINPPKLRKATTAELTDIWNNKYGVQPQRRQNLINAGIDPDDAQTRINAGEGKPQEQEKQATYLSVSKSTLYFSYKGEKSEQIEIYSNADIYSVPFAYVPTWCTVDIYTGYFIVTASPNPNYTSRKDYLKVTSGGKEVNINIEQFGRPNPDSQQSKTTTTNTKAREHTTKCFSCPKTHDTWGLTLGYAPKSINNSLMDCAQFGLKVEPLFNYGFGLNTGIILEGYSQNKAIAQLFQDGFNYYAVNVPLHLEYRLNFSKWFNIFPYGGIGFNAITNPNFDDYSLPLTFEYGGGFRISHVQFNIGKSLYLGNLKNEQNFVTYTQSNQKLNVSVSYMF